MSIAARALGAIVLPREITEFERNYLDRVNRVGLAFLAIHIPAIALVAWLNDTRPLLALLLTAAVAAGPAIAYAALSNPRSVSITYGVAAMFMAGALVHFGQGTVQIEMHFYFFVVLAGLSVFGNPVVILAAAATVALHHLVLWFALPESVFNYAAPLWVVAVHAGFVVLESATACYVARFFFNNVIELDARNRDILENVTQGFATIDRAGVPSAECSRSFERWFGAPTEGRSIFEQFARAQPDAANRPDSFAELSAMQWSEVTADVLPMELTLDQMPRSLTMGESSYRITYVPIGEAEIPERFLVVVDDETPERNRERAEQEQRECMRMFEGLLADRVAITGFFEEGSALVAALTTAPPRDAGTQKRMLHTLKGNSAIFGFHTVETVCHDLETHTTETGAPPPLEAFAKLRERWDALGASFARLLGDHRHTIVLDADDHARLERAVRSATPRHVLLDLVRSLRLEPTAKRLEHFGEQARRIASRLDKDIDVQIDSGGLRLEPQRWAGFWSTFIHAVRNAVDHGIEPASERIARGKPARGTVSLRTQLSTEALTVEIVDDGRGVDWARVAEHAGRLGLPARNEGELLDALFHDGVSTAAQVTDISGRGIGLGALKTATLALGGAITFETEQGQGTTLRIIFPKKAMSRGNAAARDLFEPAREHQG